MKKKKFYDVEQQVVDATLECLSKSGTKLDIDFVGFGTGSVGKRNIFGAFGSDLTSLEDWFPELIKFNKMLNVDHDCWLIVGEKDSLNGMNISNMMKHLRYKFLFEDQKRGTNVVIHPSEIDADSYNEEINSLLTASYSFAIVKVAGSVARLTRHYGELLEMTEKDKMISFLKLMDVPEIVTLLSSLNQLKNNSQGNLLGGFTMSDYYKLLDRLIETHAPIRRALKSNNLDFKLYEHSLNIMDDIILNMELISYHDK